MDRRKEPGMPDAPPDQMASPDKSLAPAPIAVFVHVHYEDVWVGLADIISETLRHPFHLILTTPHAGAMPKIPDSPFLLSHRTLVYPNRGRDILPFLMALGLPIDFSVGLKLHTKRSDHRLEGAHWGQALVRALLPDPTAVACVIAAITADRRLKIVAPRGMLVSLDRWMGRNLRPMRQVAERLRLDLPAARQRTPVFCAGSMFWFRRDALNRFADANLSDLFAAEAGQTDGTAAHACERLFALIAEAEDGVVLTMDDVGMLDSAQPLQALRARARMRADEPTPFLRRPPLLARWALALPGLRRLYQACPAGLRRAIRRSAGGNGNSVLRPPHL
ncbi:rhamnan synthesis F family protein [Jiella sp. M17.18]|uniref:rhamnan synthesis F family protein n=1 Tax=Jiella sp. M17.18 TaxID=3234247 RepID=UPI0034DED7B9